MSGSRQSLIGAVMLVANCLAYALYLVLSKPLMERIAPLQVLTKIFAAGTVLMLPIALPSLLAEDWASVSMRAWISLAIVIAGPTILAYLLSGWALRHADSSLVALYTYVQPVLTSILAALFLAETIRGIVVVAALLIFAGVWLASRQTGRPPRSSAEIQPPPAI